MSQFLYLKKNQLILPIGYELGFLVGIILSRRYSHSYILGMLSFEWDAKIMQALTIFDNDGIFKKTFSNERLILSGKLYLYLRELIQYAHSIFDRDSSVDRVHSFTSGIRDVILESEKVRCSPRTAEHIQKLLWYWFEEQVVIQKQEMNNKKRLVTLKLG